MAPILVILFSKLTNLYDHDTLPLLIDEWTDGQTALAHHYARNKNFTKYSIFRPLLAAYAMFLWLIWLMYLHSQYDIYDVHEREEVPGKYSEGGDATVSRVIRQDRRLHIKGAGVPVRRRLLTTKNINFQQVPR